jgi:amphi-Trp domain-containing protein
LSESKHDKGERLSRQQAAERLTDVAYALTTGGSLSLGGDREVTVPVTDEVILKGESRTDGDRVQLALELTWSTTRAT